MKVDYEYLKKLLEALASADGPTTDIEELEGKGFSYNDDEFLFHLEILHDKELVQGAGGGGLGFKRSATGQIAWSVVPLRLTAAGFEFMDALERNEVWETIKSEFKDASLGTVMRVSKDLLEGYIRKKISQFIE